MSKLRKFAQGQECTLRIEGICNFDPETTVLAHLPSRDKGMGYKSPDHWAVHACSRCHDWIDKRTKESRHAGMANVTPRNYKYELDALYETQKRLIAAGLMKV